VAVADPVETKIRAISSDGAGIGALPDGRVLFVPRAVPGDSVRVETVQARKRWARGRLLEVVEAAPDRVTPPCELFDRCGGCALQHLPYEEQLRWKGRWIHDALQRIAGRELEVPEVLPSPEPLGYRGRVSFTVRRIGPGKLVAGFHELDRPNRILSVEGQCLLPDPKLMEVWVRLREAWGDGGRRLPGGPNLRLTLRLADDGVGMLISGGRSRGDVRALVRDVEGLDAVWLEDDRGRLSHGAGEKALSETWLGETFELSADTFVQVNRSAAEELTNWVVDQAMASSPSRVIDAYAGVGLYGRAMSRSGVLCTAIEADEAAVIASQSGAPGSFTGILGLVEEMMEALLPADVVVLNPPRGGLHESVPRMIAEKGVPRVIYVSCNPATLARDLERLGDQYVISAIRAQDLFPQTAHVETAVVLERKPSLEGGGNV
jgi:23S rRNA (uracil1939-C5)-methyltransferase